MDELSLADLTVFARAAALGTLSAAARERGVPVSQVSRAIDRIERTCGLKLLRRSARGLTLTHDGDAFLAFCQQMTHIRQGLESDFARRSRQVSGRVRMSLSAAIAQHWVVPSLADFVTRHSQLDLDLLVDDALVDLAREGVDLAIRTGSITALSMVARPLGRIDTGLYASTAYLAKHGTPRRVDDLAQHTLLSNAEHPVLNRLHFAGRRTYVADGRLRSTSTAILAQMAATGLGIAHLPIRIAQASALLLQPVLAQQFESAKVPVYALMLPDRQRLPRLRACVEHLVHVFA